jgi:hypothetical protein
MRQQKWFEATLADDGVTSNVVDMSAGVVELEVTVQ